MQEPEQQSELSATMRALARLSAAGLGGAAVVAIDKLRRQFQHGRNETGELLANLSNYSLNQRRAFIIAAQNLIAAIEDRHLPGGEMKTVVNAGRRNFREPWARDFGFSTYGLLELQEYNAIRETLEVFLQFQTPEGQFPIKVHSTNILVRSIYSMLDKPQPIINPLQPRYVSGFKEISLDGNPLLVSAAVEYARRSGDIAFLRSHWLQLLQALRWMEGFAPDEDRLVSQAPYSDWADTVARSGKVLYTNVVYWKALHDVAEASLDFDLPGDGPHLRGLADQLQQSILSHFWRDELGYLITSEEFHQLSSCGNLLAIAWGCTDEAMSSSIFAKMTELGMHIPLPTKPLSGHYPRKAIAPLARLGGFPNYHEDVAWIWLGAWHVIALARHERLMEAEELLDSISAVIARDKLVYEVYKPDGKHFSNIFYTAEAPLTWSAAMLVHAFNVFNRHPGRTPSA
jgi:GH15 family glucan-1,4-alpha-glucosidase